MHESSSVGPSTRHSMSEKRLTLANEPCATRWSGIEQASSICGTGPRHLWRGAAARDGAGEVLRLQGGSVGPAPAHTTLLTFWRTLPPQLILLMVHSANSLCFGKPSCVSLRRTRPFHFFRRLFALLSQFDCSLNCAIEPHLLEQSNESTR
jgi:hypothetical protein